MFVLSLLIKHSHLSFHFHFLNLQVLAHKRSFSEFRWMVIIVDNVNILLFPDGPGAIFLCCGVCRGIKMSNSGAGTKVMSSSAYPVSDIDAHLSPTTYRHDDKQDTLEQQLNSANIQNIFLHRLLLID